VSNSANQALLLTVASRHAIPENALGVPLFVRGSRYLIGFDTAETTGRDLLALVADDTASRPQGSGPKISLPLVGDINPIGYSLPALTVLMGLADGFNPCAMWVLVYLISLIAGIIRWSSSPSSAISLPAKATRTGDDDCACCGGVVRRNAAQQHHEIELATAERVADRKIWRVSGGHWLMLVNSSGREVAVATRTSPIHPTATGPSAARWRRHSG
jgi:hypothetical protein